MFPSSLMKQMASDMARFEDVMTQFVNDVMPDNNRQDSSRQKLSTEKNDVNPTDRPNPAERVYDRSVARGRPFDSWLWPSFRSDNRSLAPVSAFPRVDVSEEETQVVVVAEIPGLKKEDLKITLLDQTLTIKGKTRHENSRKDDNYSCQECHWGEFRRSMRLPCPVVEEQSSIKATYGDGLLRVRLPKLPEQGGLEIPLEE